MNAANLVEKLKQQLSQFGLNPAEWTILKPELNSAYLRVCEHHSGLTLVGRVCAQNGDWLELSWEEFS